MSRARQPAPSTPQRDFKPYGELDFTTAQVDPSWTGLELSQAFQSATRTAPNYSELAIQIFGANPNQKMRYQMAASQISSGSMAKSAKMAARRNGDRQYYYSIKFEGGKEVKIAGGFDPNDDIVAIAKSQQMMTQQTYNALIYPYVVTVWEESVRQFMEGSKTVVYFPPSMLDTGIHQALQMSSNVRSTDTPDAFSAYGKTRYTALNGIAAADFQHIISNLADANPGSQRSLTFKSVAPQVAAIMATHFARPAVMSKQTMMDSYATLVKQARHLTQDQILTQTSIADQVISGTMKSRGLSLGLGARAGPVNSMIESFHAIVNNHNL